MKPPHCTILDPKPGIKGFISSCGHNSAVPFEQSVDDSIQWSSR